MRMRKRGQQNTVSLFAFQDVMASVIGILFFVVLLMALDIVQQKVSQASPVTLSPVDAKMQDLRNRLSDLTPIRERLEKSIAELSRRIAQASSSNDQLLLAEIRKLRRQLLQLHDGIKYLDKSLMESDKARSEKDVRHRGGLDKLEELRRVVGTLKRQAMSSSRKPRVVYIIDEEPGGLTPWLVEISAERIRVAPNEGNNSVMTFAAPSKDRRMKLFLGWARNQSPRSHYFVLLKKPSGWESAAELDKKLREQGFEIGTDLLPEDWDPFG